MRALFQALLAGWAAGDADSYAALFRDDADYIAFDGVNQKGRRAIAMGHRLLFDKYLKGSRLTGEIIGLRFLSPDVALLHTTGNTIIAGKTSPEPERASLQTLIALRRDGLWKFSAFHNSRVRPIGDLRGVLLWRVSDVVWRLFGPKPRQGRSLTRGSEA